MNNRFLALFIMTIMMISAIPLAFAQNEFGAQDMGTNGEASTAMEANTAGEMVATAEPAEAEPAEPVAVGEPDVQAVQPRPLDGARQRIRTDARQLRTDARVVRGDARQIRSDANMLRSLEQRRMHRFVERPVAPRIKRAQELFKRARERYQEAKQRYLKAKDAYMKQRQKFDQARKEWKDCKDDSSKVCQEKRQNIKKNAREHLLKAADVMIDHLDRVIERVKSSEDLSDDEVDTIVSNLESRKSDIESAKEKVESLGDDASREDIVALAKTLRADWRKSLMQTKKVVGRAANAKLGNLIERIEKVEEKLYRIRDHLAEKGMDVTALDEQLDNFSSELDAAADNYNQAKEKWKEASSDQEIADAAKDVHALLQEAKDHLKNARDSLRAAVREIKNLNNGSLDVEDDSSASSSDDSASSSDSSASDDSTGDTGDSE